MVWSPESCEVKVKRPSEGPRVLTTLCPVSASYEHNEQRVRGTRALQNRTATETHVYFYENA